MAELPEELFVEILLWLPVKSLKRFRCLSKPLCEIIDSSDFVNSHLSRSFQNFNHRKLIFQDRSWKNFQVCDVDLDVEEEIIHLGRSVSSSWKKVYGYCNGLILLSRAELAIALRSPSTRHCRYLSNFPKFGLALWNPSTHQYRHLPDFPFAVQSIIMSGLGYDDSVDDFVAFFILLTQQKIEFEFRFDIEMEVWIYGLKSNIWRKAKDFPYVGSFQDFGTGYFSRDGSLHWLFDLFSNNKCQSEIVAFDTRKETFSVVPQPLCSIKSLDGVSMRLHVLEGSLCISYFSATPLPQAYLYIREKEGVDLFTWRKLYSVTEPILLDIYWFKSAKVLGYLKRGNKILLDMGMPGMISYDLKDKRFGKVKIDKDSTWKGPILCLESLVSVYGDA